MKIEPCPFCGEDVYPECNPIRGYSGCYNYIIECKNIECRCRIYMPDTDTIYRTKEEALKNAITRWNRRIKNG